MHFITGIDKRTKKRIALCYNDDEQRQRMEDYTLIRDNVPKLDYGLHKVSFYSIETLREVQEKDPYFEVHEILNNVNDFINRALTIE